MDINVGMIARSSQRGAVTACDTCSLFTMLTCAHIYELVHRNLCLGVYE